MRLTLDAQMDRLFVHGLRVVKDNDLKVERQWRQFLKYLNRTGGKTAKPMGIAVDILTEHLFHTDFLFNEEVLLLRIKNEWHQKIGFIDSNPFILSMLESTVHRAIKEQQHGKDTQAIQYVFSKINDYVLSEAANDIFTIDAFLNDLINSEQFSFNWIATVIEKDGGFIVEQLFARSHQSVRLEDTYFGQTIYLLTEKILKNYPVTDNSHTFSVAYEHMIILFNTRDSQINELTKHINYTLQLLKTGKMTLNSTLHKQQWKDSVILFQDSLIRAHTFHEALKIITEGFVHYLPFERSAIFSYSTDDTGIGLSGIRFDSKAIQSITENVRNLPLIDKGLELLRIFGKGMRFLQPLYIQDARKSFPKEYIEQFQLKSIVVAPIFKSSDNELLGAVFLDQGENQEFTISENTYTALIKFGQSAGEILGKFTNNIDAYDHTIRFSPRELEVLQLMAEGESTTSAATILHLSEYTVRDYITSIMQKMKARNRTEAVARAIRKGVI